METCILWLWFNAAAQLSLWLLLQAFQSGGSYSQLFAKKEIDSTQYCKLQLGFYVIQDTSKIMDTLDSTIESQEESEMPSESMDISESEVAKCNNRDSRNEKKDSEGIGTEGKPKVEGETKVEIMEEGETDESNEATAKKMVEEGARVDGSTAEKENAGEKAKQKREELAKEQTEREPMKRKEEESITDEVKPKKKKHTKKEERPEFPKTLEGFGYTFNTDEVKSKKAKHTKKEERPEFPKTLEGFGYTFNTEGQLRQTKGKEDPTPTDEPFVFVVKEGDQKYNQAHYEALGEVITEYVYEKLVSEGELRKVKIPLKAKKGDPISFVFMSDGAETKEKVMVLIHGSGVVRAGQWARRLIINDCLDSGTQLPFIKRAKQEDYGVLVLNANRNYDIVNGREKRIKDNSTPEEHAAYVWKKIITGWAAKEVYIVAHSYGGCVVTYLADREKSFIERVTKIAFTDSVHSFSLQRASRSTKEWMINCSKNWVSSEDHLDTVLTTYTGEVQRVSAGTSKHEETSYRSMESIFNYFDEKKK